MELQMNLRRSMLGFSAALIVGGWGATRLADLQLSMLPPGDERIKAWGGDAKRAKRHKIYFVPTGIVYVGGVSAMALGVGMLVFMRAAGSRIP